MDFSFKVKVKRLRRARTKKSSNPEAGERETNLAQSGHGRYGLDLHMFPVQLSAIYLGYSGRRQFCSSVPYPPPRLCLPT